MPDRWVQMPQLTTCDGCGHQWRPRVRIRSTATGGEEWVMRCPQCDRRYDMVHISRRGVEVREELSRLRTDTEMDADERARRIEELIAELARESRGGGRDDGDTE